MPPATSIWTPDTSTFTWDVATGNTYVNQWKDQATGALVWQSSFGVGGTTTINDRATYDPGVVGTRPPGVRSPANHCYQRRSADNTHWTLAFTYTVVSNGTAINEKSGIWSVSWPASASLVLQHLQDSTTQRVWTSIGTPTNRTAVAVPVHKNTKVAVNQNVLLTCVFSWYPSRNKLINIGDLGVQTNYGSTSARSLYTGFAPYDAEGVYIGLSDVVDTTNATGHVPNTWPNAVNSGNGWVGGNLTSLRTNMDTTCNRAITIGGSGIVANTTWPDMYIHEIRLWSRALSETECVNAYHDIRTTTLARIPV